MLALTILHTDNLRLEYDSQTHFQQSEYTQKTYLTEVIVINTQLQSLMRIEFYKPNTSECAEALFAI